MRITNVRYYPVDTWGVNLTAKIDKEDYKTTHCGIVDANRTDYKHNIVPTGVLTPRTSYTEITSDQLANIGYMPDGAYIINDN